MSKEKANKKPKLSLLNNIISAACYAELALQLDNTWAGKTLDRIIRSRKYPGDQGEPSGIFLKYLNGQNLITESTIRQLPDGIDQNKLLFWRFHPFWKILSKDSPQFIDVRTVLHLTGDSLHDFVWFATPNNADPKTFYHRTADSKYLIDEVLENKNVDSLFLISALTREAIEIGDFRKFSVMSRIVVEVFCEAVSSCPNLYIKWPLLAVRFNQVIWNITSEAMPAAKSMNEPIFFLRENMKDSAAVAREKGVNLPPDSLVDKYGGFEVLDSYIDSLYHHPNVREDEEGNLIKVQDPKIKHHMDY